jgi:hypothetical protein
LLWESVFEWDPVWAGGQRPYFVCGKERNVVLRESVVVLFTSLDEFWTVPVPAGVRIDLAGCTEMFVWVVAITGAMFLATGFGFTLALCGYVSPTSAA